MTNQKIKIGPMSGPLRSIVDTLLYVQAHIMNEMNNMIW